MGILSAVRNDVEDLIKLGYNNESISKSVGIDLYIIEYMTKYIRKQYKQNKNKLKMKDNKR